MRLAEHGVEDVVAASGKGDQGFVVAFALGDLAVVVGAGGVVADVVLVGGTIPTLGHCGPSMR